MNTRVRWLIAIATGSASVAAPPAQWVKFQDPLEHAFTLDVPAGWTVRGGLFRLGYSDSRPMIDLTSPKGRINIRLGDVAIPAYFIPNQFHREGETYDLGAQAQLTVAHYRSGQEFAESYGKSRFQSICTNLTAQPDGSEMQLHDFAADEITPQKTSAGKASYLCSSPGGERNAYVYAKTSLFEQFWSVHTLASFVAPADQVSFARAIVERAGQSFQISPEWRQYQRQLDQEALVYQRERQQARFRQLSRQVAEFEAKMQNMQSQVNAFERRQAQQAAQVEKFGNLLTGITPTVDPYGIRRDVWTGPKDGYWVNGLGQVINSNVSPGAGWQRLQTKE